MSSNSKHYNVELITPDNKFSLEVAEEQAILCAAFQTNIDLPYLCLQGWCITCAGKIIKGEVDQSRTLRIFKQDIEEGFVLLCTATPKSDLTILTHQKENLREHRIKNHLPVPRG